MERRGLFPLDAVARRFGLALSTIEHYISKELLYPIQLEEGAFLVASDFVRLEIIQTGKRLGFSLAEIKELIDAYGGSRERLAN